MWKDITQEEYDAYIMLKKKGYYMMDIYGVSLITRIPVEKVRLFDLYLPQLDKKFKK